MNGKDESSRGGVDAFGEHLFPLRGSLAWNDLPGR